MFQVIVDLHTHALDVGFELGLGAIKLALDHDVRDLGLGSITDSFGDLEAALLAKEPFFSSATMALNLSLKSGTSLKSPKVFTKSSVTSGIPASTAFSCSQESFLRDRVPHVRRASGGCARWRLLRPYL